MAMILGKMVMNLSKEPSQRLLKHVVSNVKNSFFISIIIIIISITLIDFLKSLKLKNQTSINEEMFHLFCKILLK